MSPPPPRDSQRGPIPSVLHALLAWTSAAVALVSVSIALAGAAARAVAERGEDPSRILADPERSPLLTRPGWIAAGTLANELAVLAALGLWWWGLRPHRPSVFPLSRPSAAGIAGSLLAVFGLAPYAEAAGELVHRVVGNEITATRVVIAAARGSSGEEFVALLFCLAVMPAIAEEALFRGFITAPFERHFIAALIVPSVMFGVFHLEPTQAAGTMLLGVGFALSRLCTGSLVTPMIAHGIYNAAVLLAVRYAADVTDRSIQAGPLLGGALMVAAGSAILWRERRRHRGVEAAAVLPVPRARRREG